LDLIFNRKNFVQCLFAFATAIPLGTIFLFLAPELGKFYIGFYESRVLSTMGTPAGVALGLKQALIIIVNNLIPVASGFCFPTLIGSYNLYFANRHPERYLKSVKPLLGYTSKMVRDRLSSELYFNLTVFAFAFAFSFGFFVFGIFFGYLLHSGGVPLLSQELREISLHAPFEIAAILMSASIALGLRDSLLDEREPASAIHLKKALWRSIKSKRMIVSLGLAIMLVVGGAFVEVYLSAPLARTAGPAGF
jgi:hypothetical protein